MFSDELNYYRARRDAELALAQTSTNPKVAAIHDDMAALYDKLIALHQGEKVNSVTPFDRRQAA